MIEVKDLSVFYGKTEILKEINFSLNEGEIICVLGENGSGKSTLLKSMLKLIKFSKGKITVDNTDIKKMDNKEISKYISYIPQIHFPAFDYTVTDIILMGKYSQKNGMFFKITDREYQQVSDILEMLNITYLANKNYRQISGGERQLVLIARALLQANKYIFMDEPVANLDYGNQLKIMELCNRLRAKKIGFLITTHNPNHALIYADKVLIIQKNKESYFGDTAKILSRERLEHLYDIPIDLIELESGLNICTPKYQEVRYRNVLE